MVVVGTREASSSSSSSSISRFTYHVFLSFRGEETRKNFTDYLYSALTSAGIRTFRDDDEIERGGNIEAELKKAIHESRISLIVFSKNYASSRWCLDELVKIVEEKRNDQGREVLPIFYNVEPSEVKYQTGSFAEAFLSHEGRFKEDEEERKKWMEKVEEWREVLADVASLEGFVLTNQADGHESKFIQKIVKEIGSKLNRTILYVTQYPVGIESRARDINEWLQDGSDEVGIATVCGMGGIGKTTIAKVVYNLNYDQFEGSCFLAKIRETSEQPDGLVHLQRQLLEDILKRKVKVHNVDEGIIKIKEFIGCKRILLVLDDVDQREHLDVLIGTRDWFCPGSKILITTRREKLLKACEIHEKFRIKELSVDESVNLFSWYAFGQNHPVEDLADQISNAVKHCGGIPLALEVLGSSLCGRSVELWRSELEKLEAIPHHKIQKKLEMSYKSLQDDHDKNLFLHIATFLVGKDKDQAIKILEECDFYPIVGIQNLIDRSLVSVDNDNKLVMHQLLQDMAREILRQESSGDPEKLLRFSCHSDSPNVTREESSIEALGVDEVGTKGLKRPCSQDSLYNSVQLYRASYLKRRCLAFLYWLLVSSGLRRFFGRQQT